MHSDPIITVENLGKSYQLGASRNRERYTSLRDVIARSAKNLFKRRPSSTSSDPATDTFWALKDVSFEVRRGEVLGIIGRNGAGKSTLLKILSRITDPTEGRITLQGRVASLLEVGTGFHPELTGRENIFLNGAILGMGRVEIREKFDKIVAFAEVEKFLDTPVKRYSSGMYVRLAFAVAAHLEPEILVVDEVLAVGDAEFQKKCLGKMKAVAEGEGCTVLFVSHNMNAIEAMCSRALRLEAGGLVDSSEDVRAVVRGYLGNSQGQDAALWENRGAEHVNDWFTPRRFYLGDNAGDPLAMPVRNDTPIFVYIEGDVGSADPALNTGYALYDENGLLVCWTLTTDSQESDWPRFGLGRRAVRSRLPARLLNEGNYRLELIVSLHHRQWFCQPGHNAPTINLAISGGLSDSCYWMSRRPGLLAPSFPWELIAETEPAPTARPSESTLDSRGEPARALSNR